MPALEVNLWDPEHNSPHWLNRKRPRPGATSSQGKPLPRPTLPKPKTTARAAPRAEKET